MATRNPVGSTRYGDGVIALRSVGPSAIIAPAAAFRERRWAPLLLVAADVLAVEVAVVLAYRLPAALGWPMFAGAAHFSYAQLALAALVLPAAFAMLGLYPGYLLPSVRRLKRRLSATAGVFGLLIPWTILLDADLRSGALLALAFVNVMVLMPIADSLTRRVLINARCWGRPAVLIGAGDLGRRIAAILKASPEVGLVPVGFLDDDPARQGTKIDGLPVLGPLSSAPQAARHTSIAILATGDDRSDHLVELSAALPFPKIFVIPDLAGMQSLWLEPRDFAGIIALGVNRNLLRKRAIVIKSIFDRVLCAVALVFAAPLMALIALAVKLDTPGPVLFTQTRLGQHMRHFRVLKFRTMRVDSEPLETILARNPEMRREYEVFHKLRDDPRISRLGRMLRVSGLDELPQLWNVLRGDMSLIGPRPYMPEELKNMEGLEDVILEARPGISGFWQISGRADVSFRERLNLDIYYIRNWSLWLDLYIVLRTFIAVMSRRGAH